MGLQSYIIHPARAVTGWISPEVDTREMVDFTKLLTYRKSRWVPDPIPLAAGSRDRGRARRRYLFRYVS